MAVALASATPLPFFLALSWPEFLRWCADADLLTEPDRDG